MICAAKFCLAWTAGIALVYASQSLPVENEFAQRLQVGMEEMRHDELSAAMADLEAAVRIDPNRYEGWYQLGLLRGQIADFTGAQEDFRTAIKLKSDFAPAHYNLGLTLTADPRGMVDWPEALSEFREALKGKPEYAEALNMLGAGLTITGDAQSALQPLQHAVVLAPSLAVAHFNLGIALEKLDRLDEATKEYRLAVAARVTYPEASTALGKLLLRMRKTNEAEQALGEALRVNPDLREAHYVRARALQALKRNEEAAIEFDQAKDLGQRELDAIQSAVFSNRGLELAANGDRAGAKAALATAIALKPDYGLPHYNLGLILADGGQTAEAVHELGESISLLPGNAKPWFNLGRVLRSQGDNRRAWEALSWAARLSPSDLGVRAELDSLRAQLQASGGLRSGAVDSSGARQPDVGAASDTAVDHIAYAAQLDAQRDFLGETGELLRALALQPDAVEARRDLANSYLRSGHSDRAILEYYKVLWRVPEQWQARLGLGEALLAQDKPKEAAEQFRSALTLKPDSVEGKRGLERATRASSGH